MAKPCRYRLPGTDTWLSEADFKKTLNDGLLDKHIEDGVISIPGFKPKTEAAPVAETKVEEVKVEPVAEVKAEPTLSKKEQAERSQLDKDISSTTMKIEDLQEEIDIEKGNIQEEKERVKAEKEKIKASKMSKAEKTEKIDELDANLEDYIEDRNATINYNKDELKQEKADLKRKENRKAKLDQKAPVTETKAEPKVEAKEEAPKQPEKTEEEKIADDISLNTEKRQRSINNSFSDANEEFPILEYNGNNERIKTEVDYHNKKTSRVNKDGSWSDAYANRIIQELIFSAGPRQSRIISMALRNAGFNIPASYDLDSSTKAAGGLALYMSDSSEMISNEYSILDDKVKATEILTKAANKLGVKVATLETEAKRPREVIKSTTEAKAEPVAEAKTETKAEPVKTEKAPKAEAKESYKAKAIDKRGGDKAYTVTVNNNTADVVGEQRPSPMDPTKMTPGASYKGLPITTNINGQRVVETPAGDTIYLDKPIAEKAEETTEVKERVSEGKGANITVDVPGRSVSSPVVKMVKNRRTNQWQALKSDGTTYETSDTLKEKAEAIYQQTRTDAKVVSLPALEANTRNRQMVFSNTTNKWMEVNGEGILINVTEPSAKAAEKAYNTKREDLKRKIADAFDSKKFNLKGQLNSTPIIQISWNAILELTKKLVLAGADLTFAINDAAKKVTDQMVKENKMTEAEAQEVINYVASDDFRLRPEYSGIKNALSSDASKELSAEKIQKMTYKEALDAGEKAIESGEINPSEIINQIINVKGRSLDPIETVAMSYYRVGLDNELSDLYERLSKETNDDIQDLLINEIDIIEQKISDYDVMANITGYFNGLSLALRRVMINSQYDASIMINKVKAKYGDTKVPEGLEEKLREASNKIKDLNKEIERLKKEAEKSTDSEAVNDINEDNARRKGKKKTKEEGTHVSSKDGNVAVSTALIREAVEKGATEIEDVVNYVRADVQAMFPDATDRQIRDAISNYGKQVNPTQDKIQQEINGIKSVGRMLSKLEDIQKALANKSAFDNIKSKKARKRARRQLSEREEQLKRAIREEMAKLPLSIEDIEFINEQKLESYKKRKQNEIAELDEKILRNDLAKKGKQSTILDKEAQELKDKRDALNAELDSLRKQQPLTDEQIEERRAKRLEQYKKRLADRNKDLQRRIAEKDFSKKAKPESIKRDEEARKLEIEREKLIYEYELELEKAEMAAAPRYKQVLRAFASILNLPKALKAAIDLSAPLRQGIVPLLTQNPVKSSQQVWEMMKFFANPKSYEAFMDELRSSEYYPLLKESGLFIAEQNGKLNAMEEMLANNLGNKIPILGSAYKLKSGKKVLPGLDLYKRSEYAYSGFLNNLRVQTFLEGVGALKEMGYTLEANKDEFKSWASYVNNATGRGTMNANAAMTLGTVFFSPRLIAARMNIAMNPFYYSKLSPAARKMAMKNTGAFFAMAATITGLAALWYNNDDDDNTSVELDPRSSDFGKIKIGNSRVDFLGGFLPYFRSASQFAMGQKKSLTSGQIEELNQKYGSTTRGSIAMDFFANKLAPTTRLGYDWMFKTESEKQRDLLEKEQDNSIWNDLGYPVWAQDLTVPIWTQDIKKLNEEHGVGTGLFLTGLNLYGAGVQNFEPRYKAPKSSSSNDKFEDYSDFTEYETEGTDDYSDFPGVKK